MKYMDIVNGMELLPDDSISNPKAFDVWKEKDSKAFTIISLTIKDDQIGHIQGCTAAKEGWDKLSAVQDSIQMAGKMALRQRLVSSQLEEGGKLQEHIDFFRGIASKMKSLGDDMVGDKELVNRLFLSLPKSYEPMIMALQSMTEKLTLKLVSTRLIPEKKTRRMGQGHST